MPNHDAIDFPCADVWRDHYAAQGLTYSAGRRERPLQPPLVRTPGEDECEAQTMIHQLLITLRRQGQEIQTLKVLLQKQQSDQLVTDKPFEGVE